MGLDINLNTSKIDISEDDGLNVDLYKDNIDISDDEADDIIIEITGLKSLSKFIGLEDTPLYYDNGKFFKVENNKIIYTDIEWKDITGDINDAPDLINLIKILISEISESIIDKHIVKHNTDNNAHPYIQNIIEDNYTTLNNKIDNIETEITQDISELENALNTEIENRENADDSLSDRIDGLDEDIQEETLARVENDTTLQNNINSVVSDLSDEISARESADTTLSNSISDLSDGLIQEITDRQTADTGLQSQITSNYNTLDSKIDSVESSLNDLSDTVDANDTTINNKVDNINNTLTNSISTLSTTVSNNYTTLDNKIDSVNDTLSGDISDLSDTVSSNYTTLDNKIDDIEDTLSDSITALENTVSSNYTTLDDKIDSINGALSDEIDDLESIVSSNYTTLDNKIDNVNDSLTDSISGLDTKYTNITNTLDDKIDSVEGVLTDSITALDNKYDGITSGLDDKIDDVDDALTTHISDSSNPHNVTKTQVGLSNVDNTSDLDKPISTATQTALDGISNSLTSHTSNTNNPHNVTKTQIGLGNVDNTSDLNKPISTATQTALDGKVPNTRTVNNKALSSDITLDYSDVNALPDATTINDLTTTAQQNALNSGIDSTLTQQITTNQNNISSLSSAVSSNYTTLDNRITSEVNTLNSSISNEETARINADNGLQSQIDAITSASDVTDIVGTYAELQAYDTTGLLDNSIIKVLQDESRNNETTYYRWVITNGTGAWVLIGEEGPYYTKSEADVRFVNQTTTINNKALSSNITLTASDVGALPDNTVIGDGTLTIQKNGTTIDTFTANTTSNKTINITVPTDTQDLTNGAGYITNSALNGYATESFVLNQGYITGITSTDVTTALGYTPYNSTNPDGYTTNVGTVTSVNNTQPDANGNVTLVIPDTATWGNITGTLSNQTDLQDVLNTKQDKEVVLDWGTPTSVEALAIQATPYGGVNWKSVIYDVDRFIAIDKNGYYSEALNFNLEWETATQNSNLGANDWCDLAFGGNNLVVAIGKRGYISTKTYGMWSVANANADLTAISSNRWANIAYGNNKFVALNSIGYTAYSTDGNSWTQGHQFSVGAGGWYNITYGNNKFVALHSQGYISTSTDGINWTTETLNDVLSEDNYAWDSLTYYNGQFVTISGGGDATAISNDGINWIKSNPIISGEPTIPWCIGGGSDKIVAISAMGDMSISALYTSLTNIEGSSLYLEFSNNTYKLMDSATGIIPDARLSSNIARITDIPTDTSDLTNGAGYITSSALSGYATETWVGQQGYLVSSDLNGYATENFVTSQGYITGITSGDVTTALGYTPYDASNPSGYTSNVGTVTSVNNVSPVSGNVSLSIPSATSDLTNDSGFITSSDLTNYVTTNTAQNISGRKTFLGEKAIYFKQTATTDKLGFTLYNPSSTELGALEWRPNTINGNALLALNCPQSGSNYVGFRYWSNINIIAPRPTTNGNYFIPVNVTDGTNTVTANNNGTLNISTLLPNITVDQTYDATSANAQSGVAIAGAGFLQNTATGIDAITILGNASNKTNAINIGVGSTGTSNGVVAIGKYASASQSEAIALGYGASASAYSAIQLGTGTNSTAYTFSVGLGNNNNYQLLDGTTGLIPDARISSNIARTSSLATVATTGDYSDLLNKPTLGTMAAESASDYTPTSSLATVATTGAYSDLSGTPTIPTLYSTTGQNTDGAMTQKASTDTFANVSLSNLGATATNNIDGQWINANSFSIYNGAQNVGLYTIDLSNALPNDGYVYECIFTGDGYTLATNGSLGDIRMLSTLSTSVFLAKTQTRTTSAVQFGGTVTLIIDTDRVAQYQVANNNVGNLRIFLVSYRRIGTNS